MGYYTVPCGNCISCRLEKSRQWAVRILHESMSHEQNCFVTITYDDANLVDKSLHKEDLQNFFKRLRKAGLSFRYFASGEYGDSLNRPHYHICFFGQDFLLENRELMEKCWGKGITHVGALSFESAAYVARYVTKKLKGEDANVYTAFNLIPEFALMSRRPGIGYEFFIHNLKDSPLDHLYVRGEKAGLPRYYQDKKYTSDAAKIVIKKKNRLYSKQKEADTYQNSLSNNVPIWEQQLNENAQKNLNVTRSILNGNDIY